MKYYIIVKNAHGDNLAVFETFDEAVAWMEKITSVLISSLRIQIMPKEGDIK
jgi:hypothetical protein